MSESANSNRRDDVPAVPPSLLSRNPLRWLSVFGPGAIIASLTIGTGELIFSSRGGALFGYSVLWIFLAISVLKWGLVFATARHMVLSGAHPLERSMALRPAGFLPLLFFVPAVICFPIWIGFHSGVIGTLVLDVGGVDKHAGGTIVLLLVLAAVFLGGYRYLERAQLVIVTTMLVCVAVSAVLMSPDWIDVLAGAIVPRPLEYPPWLGDVDPALAGRPVWVEASTYVGVIGGASYDYLAYVSFLREKRWGLAGAGAATGAELEAIARDRDHPARRWVRAPLVDCTLSFVIVIIFSAVFVISGTLALAPQQAVPTGDNLLALQSQFVTRLHPWLYPLYIAGAFLTMLGTLYGTIEVAPAMMRELVRALFPRSGAADSKLVRNVTVAWCGLGALGVLGWSLALHLGGSTESRPPTLVEIVTPAALFTGVFSCAFVCFLAPWMDRRFLPPALRMHPALAALNIIAGVVFLAVGVKGYVDHGATAVAALIGAALLALALVPVVRNAREG